MKFQRWSIPQPRTAVVDTLMEAGYSYLVSSVLACRGVENADGAREFLQQETVLHTDPLLMKDMDKAVSRIHLALERGERIAVFGDYDVDGITATCLLTDYLRSCGADCLKYIPRRIEDGYGLGNDAITSLQQQGVSLIITVDCGITGVEETEFAAALGVDLVITDHHECKEILPAAVAVVDPHRPDCPYPFKHLAGVGVALKLVLALGGKEQEQALFERYCTLAAIGTVADVMKMSDENRTIVHCGLQRLENADFVGLHALLRESGLADKEVTSIQIGFVLAPRINAAGRMGQADLAADLLLTRDSARAEELARALCELNRERQAVEQSIFAEAVDCIGDLAEDERSAIVLSSSTWHQGVVGIVASRLSEKYSCPSFMIHLTDGMGKGSCRSYGGFNLFAALEQCSDLLEGFGGHELAAGFTIREENIPAFRSRINRISRAFSGEGAPVSSLEVDVVLQRLSQVTLEGVESLSMLEPYGVGNNRPVFCLCGATLENLQSIGQNKHLKLQLTKGQNQFEAIFFSATAAECGLSVGQRVDAAFYLQINEFRGNRSLQLQLLDIRPSQFPSSREEENGALCRRALDGQSLSARELKHILPSREQFVHLWRALQRLEKEGRCEDALYPLLRRLAAMTGGSDAYLRTLLCLAVFEERGLLHIDCDGQRLRLQLCAGENKVDLESSPYMQQLRNMERNGNGGEDL